MDHLPRKIETKTSPFSLPKSTTNSIQNKRIKTMVYSPKKENNFFYLATSVFVILATGIIVYVLISLSQLQKLSQVSNTTNTVNTTNTTNNTVEVSDTDTIQSKWALREIKINNNVVWSLQLPSAFIETTVGASDGITIFSGDEMGENYKLQLGFPLFTNYPGSEPEDLKSWIQKELDFLKPEDSLNVKSESFTLSNNVQATLLLNMNEITADSGNARIFGQKKSLVLYISKTKNRNFSKITLIPQGEYREETAKSIIERIASSIKF